MTSDQDKENPGQAGEQPAPEWSVEQMLKVVDLIYFLSTDDRFPPS